MQSIVRHDYYPNSPSSPEEPNHSSRSAVALRRITPMDPHPLRAVDAMGASSAGYEAQRAMPASKPRRIDVFRLFVAVAGLMIYLGLPAAAIAYLLFDLVG